MAVWAHNLSGDDFYYAIKYQTMLTHSNQIAIDACYLYCFAIKLLIINGSSKDAYL
jgi:hypothetical protein